MPSSKPEETYYDILKVEPRATIAEIVAAYHTAKNAFSRDSIATYSLFAPEEAQGILDKLEEAYMHLSNIDKKREYDRRLAERTNAEADVVPPSMTELERKKNAQGSTDPSPIATVFSSTAIAQSALMPEDTEGGGIPTPLPSAGETSGVQPVPDQMTGVLLREIREKRALSVDDVSRITKIPTKFLRAIEADEPNGLPARVYLQGFVKNLAALYKLPPQETAKVYLAYIDARTKSESQD